MNKLAIFSLAVGMTASTALAGGYVAPVIEQPVVISPSVREASDWAGFYLGANVNNGQVKLENDVGTKLKGTLGAVRAGYDWQIGRAVVGLGGEYNFGKYDGSIIVPPPFPGASFPATYVKIEQVATVFARAGYVFNDKLLAYGLVGYTRGKLTNFFEEGAGAPEDIYSHKESALTLGLGAEYRFSEIWSGYAEYAHTKFDKTNDDWEIEHDLSQIKLGVNYRF